MFLYKLRMPAMKIFQDYFLHRILASMITLLVLINAQTNPPGFINIDCGIEAGTTSFDSKTNLTYTSDAAYITSGVSTSLTSATDLVFQTLRTFPDGIRNCYNISLTQGNKYLVKALFYYGNYDELNIPPVFDLYLGASKWANVQPNSTFSIVEEIIHAPSLNYISMCLVNLGRGNPFISAIELRELMMIAYETPSGVSLVKLLRKDLGSSTYETLRYPDDLLDRLWDAENDPNQWNTTTTSWDISNFQEDTGYQLPWKVMNTAVTPFDPSKPLIVGMSYPDCTRELYVYAHLAELRKLEAGENRTIKFEVEGSVDGWSWTLTNPLYLASYTLNLTRGVTASGTCEFNLSMVGDATLPPFCNAYEFYYAINDTLLTEQADVYAMANIKSTYEISRNWQGDPCAPKAYAWEGLICRYQYATPPVVTSLDLSSGQLTGQIAPDLADLKYLQTLDLSNNSLTGPIPNFLSQLPSLKVLNLIGNNLSGSVPTSLLAKSKDGSLSLNVSGNPDLCQSSSCSAPGKKGNNKVVLVVVIVVALLLLAVALALLLWNHQKKRHQHGSSHHSSQNKQALNATDLEANNRQLTYSDILKITNNFERPLGKGAFGTVYYGDIDGTPVAVKMLSPSSAQGFKEFQAEVKSLVRVHHKNLTSLVGYCNEGSNFGLVYEYMANGDLEYHLSKNNPEVQNWERRLQIAHEAAQGLEYLHRGCKPQIVHRDIKTTNILLNDQLQAKLADFGLSRAFPTEGGSHVTTSVVAGTPGYLDPEYYVTNWLTDKSDVYSFGVVLLEIITGLPVIAKTSDRSHIGAWVESMLENGDIKSIVDPRLGRDFDVNSVWKIVELAMACVSASSVKRPTMTQVVSELNECLAAETARTRQGMSIEPTDSSCYIRSDFHTGTSPLLR